MRRILSSSVLIYGISLNVLGPKVCNGFSNPPDHPLQTISVNNSEPNNHSIQKRSINMGPRGSDSGLLNIKKELSKKFYEKIKFYSDLMDSRYFERSACSLNEYKNGDKMTNKKIGYRVDIGIDSQDLEISFATFLKDMFGSTKSCERCTTSVLEAHYDRFVTTVNDVKRNIENRIVKKGYREQVEPLFINYTLGEFAYIQYYIVYDIVDWKNYGTFSSVSVDHFYCVMFPNTEGCKPEIAHLNKPTSINVAYYVFYSEIKLKPSSMIDNSKIVPLMHKLKEESMIKYFQYEFIKEIRKTMPVDFHKDYQNVPIRGEKNIERIINSINHPLYPSSYGVCSEVVQLLEKCWPKNKKNRHFIFLIDGSRSVTDNDFDNMKKSIESMVNYPMNGMNRLSIIEFSSSQQSLCRYVINPENISWCIRSKPKLDDSSNINRAIEFARKNYIEYNQHKYDHVVVIFTAGKHQDSVQNEVASLRRMAGVSVTGFGIGNAFKSHSALQELKFITNERYNLDENKYRIKPFEEFERNRLELQNTICSA